MSGKPKTTNGEAFDLAFAAIQRVHGEQKAWGWVAALLGGEPWANDLEHLIKLRADLDRLIAQRMRTRKRQS